MDGTSLRPSAAASRFASSASTSAEKGADQLPVVSEANDVLGTVTEGNLSAQLLAGRVKSDDPVSKVVYKNYRSVSLTATLAQLAHLFDSTP